jgi:hypothetical protein
MLGCAAVRTVWGGAHVVLRVACLLLGLMMAPHKAAEEEDGEMGVQEAAGGAAMVALSGGLLPADLFNRGEIVPMSLALCVLPTHNVLLLGVVVCRCDGAGHSCVW